MVKQSRHRVYVDSELKEKEEYISKVMSKANMGSSYWSYSKASTAETGQMSSVYCKDLILNIRLLFSPVTLLNHFTQELLHLW